MLTVGITMLAFSLWGMWCNDRTGKDRQRLIDRVYAEGDYRTRRVVLDDVTYDSHMWRRLFLLDPWEMYPDWARPNYRREVA